MREVEQLFLFHAAEILAREQFGRQDDLRTLARGFFHQRGHGSDVVGRLGAGERQLQDGDGQLSHAREIGSRRRPDNGYCALRNSSVMRSLSPIA